MKKILDVRHYKSMIEILKRIKRQSLAADEKRINMLIENYENLLEFVQNN